MTLHALTLLPSQVGDPTGPANDDFQDQYDQAQGLAAGTLVLICVLGVIGLVYTVFWIWTLIDAATKPDAAWSQVGQSKFLWIVVMVVFGVASIVYVFWPRPQLRAAVAGSRPRMHLAPGGGV